MADDGFVNEILITIKLYTYEKIKDKIEKCEVF